MKQVAVKTESLTECQGEDSVSSIMDVATPTPKTKGGLG